MTAQQLKNSILQMAVQGKLVPQDKNDEPASVLLEHIKAEKQALIKAGKIKKEKPLAPITEDEIPFDIPESWEWVRLGEILHIESGKGLTSKQMIDGGIPVYGGNGITGYHNESNVHEETVVIGRVGYYCGSVHITEKEAWVTDNAFITTYPEKYIYREYLVYSLRHMNLGQNNNATAQPVVSGKKIYPLLFPIPPLSEQKRIVAKIEELLPYIEKYDKAETKLTELNAKFPDALKKSILQEAVQGKLVPQNPDDEPASVLLEHIQAEKQKLIKEGKIKKEKPLAPITEDEIPFEIPESWEWVHISDMSFFQEGPGILAVDFRTSGIPLIRISGMQSDIVSLEGCNYLDEDMVDKKWKHFKLDEGDIVISTSASMDKIAEVDSKSVGAIPYTGLIRFKMYGGIEKDFFKWFIKSPFYAEQVNQQKAGGTIKHYGPSHLKKMIIPIPPLEEQKRIVAKIEELMPFINAITE